MAAFASSLGPVWKQVVQNCAIARQSGSRCRRSRDEHDRVPVRQLIRQATLVGQKKCPRAPFGAIAFLQNRRLKQENSPQRGNCAFRDRYDGQ